jgi:hypothetical protein
MRFQHSGGAAPTTISGQMTDVTLDPFDIEQVVGWPDGSVGPFFVVIDRGLLTEEKLLIASRVGNRLTILERGADGTPQQPHADGAVIEHVFSAREADEANAHVEATGGVHGLAPGRTVASEEYVADEIADAAPTTYQEQETAAGDPTGAPSLTTTVHALPYPDLGDDLRVQEALRLLAEALDGKVPIILHGTGAPPEPAGDWPEGTVFHRTEA